jgi:hypothetical protein
MQHKSQVDRRSPSVIFMSMAFGDWDGSRVNVPFISCCSIAQLAKDVADSVHRAGDGYLAKLNTSPLDTNFDTAIFQIYSP